jgi:hypothetical protein
MPRLVLALLCLLGTAFVISACGGSSGAPTRTDPADRALAFSRCMRSHGIKDFPDPQVGAGGAVKLQFKAGPGSPDPQKMGKAQEACRHLIAAGEKKLSPQERVEREEQVNKFARCMREHGVNVHASTAGGGAQIQIRPGGGGGGPNPESPSFQAAQKAFQGLLPFKGGPPGSGKGGAGSGPETSHSKASGSGASFGLSAGG